MKRILSVIVIVGIMAGAAGCEAKSEALYVPTLEEFNDLVDRFNENVAVMNEWRDTMNENAALMNEWRDIINENTELMNDFVTVHDGNVEIYNAELESLWAKINEIIVYLNTK